MELYLRAWFVLLGISVTSTCFLLMITGEVNKVDEEGFLKNAFITALATSIIWILLLITLEGK